MTPYELSLAAEAFHELKVAEMEENITMAWLREYYHRQKYLPDLKKEISKLTNKQPKEMTDDEMLDVVKHLNSQMGGSVISKDGE
jgi:hypothetical protein